PSGRMDVVAASGTRPRLAPLLRLVALEDAIPVALRTVSRLPVLGVAGTPEPFQAGVVVGELAHELHERERGFRGFTASRLATVNRGHLSLLVGKKASRVAACGAFALSKPNLQGRSDGLGPHSSAVSGGKEIWTA